MSVSVILPAYNEERAIERVIADIRMHVPSAEIIVIDDGSTDKTAEIIHSLDVTIISHKLRLGAGRSVKDGIIAATNERIVMLDSDATYPAEKIPDVLSTLENGYDLVIGARKGRHYWSSPFKIVGRILFRFLAEFATGKRIPDINSGMRAFKKSEVIQHFPHLTNGFSLPTTMTLAYLFTGKQVKFIPIPYYKRIGKSKVRIVRDTLRALQYITESILRFNPLKLFLLIALCTLCIGILVSFVLYSLQWLFGTLFVAVLIFSLGLVVQGVKT